MTTTNETAVETVDTPDVANAKLAAIKTAWETLDKTVKAVTVRHTVKDGEEGVKGFQTVENVVQTTPVVGATGEALTLFKGTIDLAGLKTAPLSILRSYAAPALVLDAGQRFKAKVIAGQAEPGDAAAMQACLDELLATHTTMTGITPSAPNTNKGTGNGGLKAKLAKAETELQEAAARAAERKRLRALANDTSLTKAERQKYAEEFMAIED